jgi:hypothetical protein
LRYRQPDRHLARRRLFVVFFAAAAAAAAAAAVGRIAEAKLTASPRTNKATGLQIIPSGEHAVRGGKYDGFVTDAECARTRIPDAPLPLPSQGTHLRISGVSRFLLPTFLCGRQRKVGAPPHRGNTNKPIRPQGKANKNTSKGQQENKERPKSQTKERPKI